MKKRLRNRMGGFFKNKSLTVESSEVYDVIAVNKKDGTILKIGVARNLEEAIVARKSQELTGFSFYILENKSILMELPER
jgi:hypothetical protein